MPTLSESRGLRLLTFSALYFAQGVPWGFVGVGYPLMLADAGFDNTAIGKAMMFAYLPWAFKVVWGPLADAMPHLRVGRRRPLVIGAQMGIALTMLALAALDPKTALAGMSALIFLNNTFASLQDVAVDGMAIELLHDDERGRANAGMWAGKLLGVVAGGGGGTLVAGRFGWDTLFTAIAVSIAAIALLPILFRERPASDDDVPVTAELLGLLRFLLPVVPIGLWLAGTETLSARLDGPWPDLISVVQPVVTVALALACLPLLDRPAATMLWSAFRPNQAKWGALAAFAMPVGYALVAAPTTRLLRIELGLDEGAIATLSGAIDPVCGALGALLGGWCADALGYRNALGLWIGAIAAWLAAWAGTAAIWSDFTTLMALTAAGALAVNAFSAVTLGLYMGLCDARVGATQFTVFMALTNLTYAWTSPVGGVLADRFGYVGMFGAAAAIQLAAIALAIPFAQTASASD